MEEGLEHPARLHILYLTTCRRMGKRGQCFTSLLCTLSHPPDGSDASLFHKHCEQAIQLQLLPLSLSELPHSICYISGRDVARKMASCCSTQNGILLSSKHSRLDQHDKKPAFSQSPLRSSLVRLNSQCVHTHRVTKATDTLPTSRLLVGPETFYIECAESALECINTFLLRVLRLG